MILEKEEFHKVVGEIYKMTNIITNKHYIGQTRSHRLNHSKYRPFGYMGRFNDHISESKSSKPNNSKYLNSSIRKHGSENFKCEKILECKLDELDFYEMKYISEFNTKYPNGYNLTDGGQQRGSLKGEKITIDNSDFVPLPLIKEPRDFKRSDKTKKLISEGLISAKKDINVRKEQMKKTQIQHHLSKFELFRNATIDINNIEQYIHVIKNNCKNYEYIRVIINKVKTAFVGKYETLEEIKERAINFIKELIEWQHDQNAGNLLRALTTTSLSEMTEEGTRVMTE
jgi:hypothetical protein